MKETDSLYYRLIADEFDASEFEQLLYLSSEIECQLPSDDYLSLISINYNSPCAVYDAKTIVKKYVDVSEYYEWYISKILDNIVNRAPAVHTEIKECYYLYCWGLKFMDNLAFGFGLAVAAPPHRNYAGSWDELTEKEKQELIDSMYPEVAQEAQLTLNWVNSGKVILNCSDYGKYGLGYIDNRDIRDRKVRRYKSGTHQSV